MSTSRRLSLLAAPILLILSSASAQAADQTIRGGRLVVRNPAAAEPAGRKVSIAAKSVSAAAMVGSPLASGAGALLTIELVGIETQRESFFLAQGTAANGKPFWKALSAQGFRYLDPDGEQGPVRSLTVRQVAGGKIKLIAKLAGKAHALELVPPGPGTEGMVTVELSGGDRYCAQFGTDAKVRNVSDRLFRLSRPSAVGCPTWGASGEVLALSYNVAGLPQGLSGSDPEINTPLIGPLLNDFELVLLQETWLTPDPNPLAPTRTYHEVLEAASEHPFQSVSAEAPLGSDPARPSALLADGKNRFSRFPFEPVTRIRWSSCHASSADCLAQKGFTYSRTTFAPGVEVDVYNLHMEAGGDPEDEAIRDAGVTQLIDAMTTVSAGRAVIIGGDFNLHTDEEPDATQYQRLLDDAGLTDVCTALSCNKPFRIDKFAYRSAGGITLTPLSWKFKTNLFERDDGEPLSDHDALEVNFQWDRATP